MSTRRTHQTPEELGTHMDSLKSTLDSIRELKEVLDASRAYQKAAYKEERTRGWGLEPVGDEPGIHLRDSRYSARPGYVWLPDAPINPVPVGGNAEKLAEVHGGTPVARNWVLNQRYAFKLMAEDASELKIWFRTHADDQLLGRIKRNIERWHSGVNASNEDCEQIMNKLRQWYA